MLQTTTQWPHYLKHKLQGQNVNQLGCFAGFKNTNWDAVLQTSKQKYHQVSSENTNCKAVLQKLGQPLRWFQSSITKKTASTGNEHIIPSLIKVSLLTAESECQDSKKWRKCDANYVFSRSTAYLGGKFISEINF